MRTAITSALVIASATALGLWMQPDAKSAPADQAPVVRIEVPKPVADTAPPPPVQVAYSEPVEAAMVDHPWMVVSRSSETCPYLTTYPEAYIDLIRADGVRVDILSAGPNHFTIGDADRGVPVQLIVRGMECLRAKQALKVMQSY